MAYASTSRAQRQGTRRPGPNIHVAAPFNSDIEVECSGLRFFSAARGTLCIAAPGRGGILL